MSAAVSQRGFWARAGSFVGLARVLARVTIMLAVVLGGGLAARAASGLLIAPTALPTTVRTQLANDIAAAKLANAAAFTTARTSFTSIASASRMRDGRLPEAQLDTNGTAMILPIIEILAFDTPAQGTVSNEAWKVWKLSLVRSLGRLRAQNGAPVLIAALGAQSDADILTTAAEALGRMRTTEAVTKLVTMGTTAGSKQVAVLKGMRTCRKLAAADALATLLAQKPSTSVALAAVRSLASLANASAWSVPSMSAAEGESTRKSATKALVSAFVRYTGQVREAARIGMMVVGHATLRAELTAARASADTATKTEIDALLALPVSTWMP